MADLLGQTSLRGQVLSPLTVVFRINLPHIAQTTFSAAIDFVYELFKRLDGAFHLFRVDAVGHTEVAGHAEAVGRHENQVVVLGFHAERVRIIF